VKSYTQSFICVVALLIAAVLPASAGSITYNSTATVTGNGVSNTSVTATFTLTPSSNGRTDTISAGALTFTGVFGSFTVDFSGVCKVGSPCVFAFWNKNGDIGSYTINLTQLTANGTIWNGQFGKKSENGTFSDSLSVPEGGSKFSYLAPAGLVIFGGILLSGRLRPRVGRQERI